MHYPARLRNSVKPFASRRASVQNYMGHRPSHPRGCPMFARLAALLILSPTGRAVRVSTLLALGALSGLLALTTGCGDDLAECTPPCGAGFECGFNASDAAVCLEVCGSQVCQDNQTCTNNQCVTNSSTCPPGQHSVSGNCIPNYTTANVCDPYFACRRLCGTSTSCLEACRTDASTACRSRLDAIVACETRNNCSAASFNEACCSTEFCAAWISNPNCGNVPACDVCAQAAGDDIEIFEDCAADEPACDSCLEPFFSCGGTSGNCTSFFCDCVSAEYCN
jgi:hypothetical protein